MRTIELIEELARQALRERVILAPVPEGQQAFVNPYRLKVIRAPAMTVASRAWSCSPIRRVRGTGFRESLALR